MDLTGLGRTLIIIGIAAIIIGIFLILSPKLPFIGKLPGDFSWKGKNWSVYFPLATSLIVSVILSLILYLINKFR